MSEDVIRTGRDLAYQGTVLKVYKDHMKFSNGNTEEWDFIHHDGAAAVIPVMEDGKILMVKQYRNALERDTLEIPAGKLDDPNEEGIVCAARELKEEIGATIVNEPILLGNVISDSGLTGNRVDVYLVEIESFQQNQLIHEGIKQIIEIPVNKMDDWIRQGKIDDGFSLSAYALYQSHIK